VSERPEAARPGHRSDPFIEHLGRKLFDATTGLADEVVVMHGRAWRVSHAPDAGFDAVYARQRSEGHQEIQGAEDGSPAHSAARQLTHKLL
jgi:hypothetical protein